MNNYILSKNAPKSLKRELVDKNESFNSTISKISKIDIMDFKCKFCWRSFANSASLKQHLESFHSSSNLNWICSECKKVNFINNR